MCFCSSSRPDNSLLWFLTPLKAIKHLVCNQYKWLVIKIVTALLLLAMLALFLYSMPGYMVKKMLGAWDIVQTPLQKVPAISLTRWLVTLLSLHYLRSVSLLSVSVIRWEKDCSWHSVLIDHFSVFLHELFLEMWNVTRKTTLAYIKWKLLGSIIRLSH